MTIETHPIVAADLMPGNDAAAPAVRVWLEQDGEAPAGFGRVMVGFGPPEGAASEPSAIFSFAAKLFGILSPENPRLGGNIVLSGKSAANDNVFWFGSDDGDEDTAGIFASDVDATTLADGTTVVAWVGQDQRVHAKTIPAGGDEAVDAEAAAKLDDLLSDLGDAGQGGHAAGRLRVSPFGQNGFAAMWIADFGMTAALMGKALMLGGSAGTQQGLGASDGWKLRPLDPIPVPRDATGLAVNVKAGGGLSVTYSSASCVADDGASATHDVTVSAEDLAIDAPACEMAAPATNDEGGTVQVALNDEAPIDDAPEAAPASQSAPETAEARTDAGETESAADAEQPGSEAGGIDAPLPAQVADQTPSLPAANEDMAAPQDVIVVAALDQNDASAEPALTDGAGEGSSEPPAGEVTNVPDSSEVQADPAQGEVTDVSQAPADTTDTGETGTTDASPGGSDGGQSAGGEDSAPPADVAVVPVDTVVPAESVVPAEPEVIYISGISSSVRQSAPQVVNGPQNTVTVLYQQAGAAPGQTALVVTALTPGTTTVSPPVVLTQTAVTSLVDQPEIDLQPALAPIENATAVVWAESSPDGTSLSVKIQAYAPDGTLAAPEPVVVAVGEPGETMSDFAVAGWSRCHQHTSGGDDAADTQVTQPVEEDGTAAAGAVSETAGILPDGSDSGTASPESAETETSAEGDDIASADPAVDAEPASEAEVTAELADVADDALPVVSEPVTDEAPAEVTVAVAWVKNADASGYGTIMGQRFAVHTAHDADEDEDDDGDGALPPGFVALGADGVAGDGHDGPFALTDDASDGTTGNAIGRSPMLADTGDGSMVVGWIAETSPGSGVEVIDGVVLSEDGAQTPLSFDLTALMPRGLVKDTQPTIQATAGGDIVIGWVQPAEGEDAGYEAVIAVYRKDAEGNWAAPEASQVLATFEDKPKNLAFALGHGDVEKISVTWVEKGRVIGETFDLDGASLDQFSYKAGKGSSGSAQDSTIADEHLAAVVDGTGGLVVVFAENDGENTGLGAVMVSVGQDSSSGPGSQDGTGLVVEVLDEHEVAAQVATSQDAAPVETVSQDGEGPTAFADEEADAIVFADSISGGPGSSGSGSDGAANDNPGESPDLNAEGLLFNHGFGNDIADYYDEDELADDIDVDDVLAQAFDALQFANALNSEENMEVLTFDVSNVVLIRDFETL